MCPNQRAQHWSPGEESLYQVMNGVRVLEVAGYVCAPTAGAILADWGADVLKIEHPIYGDPYRGLRSTYVDPGRPNPMLELPNRGKRSVGIDLATDDGRDLLYRLLETSDVFLTSFMVDALDRLGLDYESLKKINPKLVYARSSGYGTRGPDAAKPGFDGAAAWARAGLMHRLTDYDADSPAEMPGSVGDLTGALSLAAGIAAGLFQRERTGQGTQIDIALFHMGIWLMSQTIGAALLGIDPDTRRTPRLNPPNPLVNTYRTSDNRWIFFNLLQADRHWADFCKHVGVADLIDDPRFANIDVRAENSKELVAILDEMFGSKPLDDWQERLGTLDAVWSAAQTTVEVAKDPQALATGFFSDVTANDGSHFFSPASPLQFGGKALGDLRAMPELAQHTEEVLLELGLSWDEISKLKEAGAIS